MSRRRWFPVIVTLACLPTSPAEAQLLSDPATLRPTYQAQAEWVDSLASARHEAALRFLEVSEALLGLPGESEHRRLQLLGDAQGLFDRVASLDEEIEEATAMARDTRGRLISALESRLASLRSTVRNADPAERTDLEARIRQTETELEGLRGQDMAVRVEDPLGGSVATLVAVAEMVADEYERLRSLWALREELRLFLGGLRLFDEMSLPPSARSGGGDDPGSGCEPSACAIGGASPADIPLMHSQPDDAAGSQGMTTTTPTSLARLFEQLTAHVEVAELSVESPVQDDMTVNREVSVGVGFTGFESEGSSSAVGGPRGSTSLLFSWTLGGNIGLTIEPSVGGRAIRSSSSTFGALAGEVRETLTGNVRGGPSRWQVMSWQKGRFLSDPLPSPGYLEPGRVEAGLIGRLALALDSRWWLEAEGGADGIRYEPEDWSGLDRHGMNTALGLAWRGVSRSARLVVRGSHHRFPNSLADWEERRKDTRLGVEVNGAMEGSLVVRLTLSGTWNRSEIPAYDFRLGRAALVLSAPWGKGSLQAYGALAHQEYLNPGPEGARVAPSDQDSGSILSLQYAHPLDRTRLLMVRGGWSRSQTGFRDEFYDRFGLSVHFAFRGG